MSPHDHDDDWPPHLWELTRRIAEVLVRGSYDELAAITGGVRLPAEELRRAVCEYGHPLEVPPSPKAARFEVIPITASSPPAWAIACDLWSGGERSPTTARSKSITFTCCDALPNSRLLQTVTPPRLRLGCVPAAEPVVVIQSGHHVVSHTCAKEVHQTIARALVRLSRHSLGGLVVLAGRDDLQTWLRGGVACDALLFEGLIEALFAWEATADGALIVSGDRIIRRQAVFGMPTGDDPPGDARWGCRHLAALAISCCCDSVALVVSEERGDITRFSRGSWRVVAFPTRDDADTWSSMESEVFDLIEHHGAAG